MDGIGVNPSDFGNAVQYARPKNMAWLKKHGLYAEIAAHGPAVGLPSEDDIGNSEVGHNALGAGRIFDQGAKLINKAIEDGSIYEGKTWKNLIQFTKDKKGKLHFIGLLSDGNVHSHEKHLFSMLRQAQKEGIKHIRLHVLLDGRDVSAKSAEVYLEHLQKIIKNLQNLNCDIKIASGGGRMSITMDRYEADWSMVERGWETHVLGKSDHTFPDIHTAISEFRKKPELTDQYIPGFVITENNKPVGTINDGDGVILFNFRGDRAVEISQAFEKKEFDKFDRKRFPDIFYAGMMEYDADLHIPKKFLVNPPVLNDTQGEYIADLGLKQFACSETQKFGHVTFFWNGNRSGYFDKKLEEYLEIPSDNINFDEKPWMKAYEITQETIKRMHKNSFDMGRINFANGDMVGHTGNFAATVMAVETVDLMLGHLTYAAKKTNTTLVVLADHGNAEIMFDTKTELPNWTSLEISEYPKPRTSHTVSPVPLYIYDPQNPSAWKLTHTQGAGLSNIANTCFTLMGIKNKENYNPSLISQG